MKRMLSLVLAVVMCLSLLPLGTMADEEIAEEAPAEDVVEEVIPAPEPEREPIPEPAPAPEPEPETTTETALEYVSGLAPASEMTTVEVPSEAEAEPESETPTLDGTIVVDSGTWEGNLTWMVTDDGKLTISGTGRMTKKDDETEYPWGEYRERVTTLVIDEGVTSIAGCAFCWFYNLVNVTLPSSLKSIGEGAFLQCGSLTSITIPSSVTSIGGAAFEECGSLTSITIPSSVTSIGDYAFYDCTSLTSITIPSSVTSIAPSMFSGCYNLTSVDIPYGVKSIGKEAFVACTSLTSVTLPESVTSIEDNAFRYSGLTRITIPDSVTSIGKKAFNACENLVSIAVGSGNKNYSSSNGVLFNKKKTMLIVCPGGKDGNYTIPNSVTEIEGEAFFGCSSLTGIIIPDSVVIIGESAFYGCSSLTSITIPDSVGDLRDGAFAGCASLKSITLPDSVWWGEISEATFARCESLTSIKIPDGVTKIGPLAFFSCSALTSITLPDGVTGIENRAFYNCYSMASITLPDSITSIGEGAFSECDSLSNVYYEGSESNWKLISIGNDNEPLTTATICFKNIPGEIFKVYSVQEIREGEQNAFFSYYSEIAGKTATYSSNFYYNENWFFNDTTKYQHGLTQMSIRLAMAAGDTQPVYIKELFSNLGFTHNPITTEYPAPGDDTIGYAIASKNIVNSSGEVITLIVVAVRGGGYKAEWADNFRVGDGLIHQGFNTSAGKVVKGIKKYISDNKDYLGDNYKIWIAGYSRAAAVTNLVGKRLDDGEIAGISKDDVFAFCFECPQNTCESSTGSAKYKNIVSIVNPIDMVTMVAPSSPQSLGWKYKRYGTVYYLPSVENTNSQKYSELKDSMMQEYASIIAEAKPSELVWSLVYEHTSEARAQATKLENFWSKLAHQFGTPRTYSLVFQEGVMNSAKQFLGNSGGVMDNPLQFVLSLLTVVGLPEIADCALNPAATSLSPSVLVYYSSLIVGISLFVTEEAQYGHYMELCLAWIDALNGQYTTNEKRKVFVNCPVNISVYDDTGALVGQIVDNDPLEIEGGVYAYIDDDGQKVLVLPPDAEYDLQITATGDGMMTYTVAEYEGDGGEIARITSYYEVPIVEGNTLLGTIEDLTETSEAEYPLITEDGDVLKPDVDVAGSIDEYSVSVSSKGSGTAIGGGAYYVGEFAQVTATPDDYASFLGWYEDGLLVSEEAEYRFCVTRDVTLTAVFEGQVPLTGKWVKESGGWRYQYEDGCYAAFQLVEYDGKMYYLNASGYLYTGTGWLMIDGSWRYFSAAAMVTGLKKIGGAYYFFKDDGTVFTGMLEYLDKTYYYDPDNGKLVVGWKEIGGNWHYFDPSTAAMAVGLKKINGSYYLFNEDGTLFTGWLPYDGAKYYYDETYNSNYGKLVVGWKLINGYYYYFSTSTAKMVTGWVKYNGYYFYTDPEADGRLVQGTTKEINGVTYTFDEIGICRG